MAEEEKRKPITKYLAKPPDEPERKIEEIKAKPPDEPKPKKDRESRSE